MKDGNIEEYEINSITEHSPPRERAFFTVMRQSGLKPNTIKQLKIGNVERILETDILAPCRIDSPKQKHPTFIGYEAVNYIKRYLATREKREKLTQNSLLFTARKNPNKEISPKNVSRAFKREAKRLHKNNLQLSSLTRFYEDKTKEYRRQLEKNGTPRDEELCRKLYEDMAMDALETEPLKRSALRSQDSKIRKIEGQLARDSQFISSILSLLHSDAGDPGTHENEEIGDRLIDLWKELDAAQRKNLLDAYMGKAKLFPLVSPPKEFMKKLEQWLKPYRKQEEDANRR